MFSEYDLTDAAALRMDANDARSTTTVRSFAEGVSALMAALASSSLSFQSISMRVMFVSRHSCAKDART